MSNGREVFDAKMSSEKGLEADPLRPEKSAQEMRARELAAARQQLLCADRQNRANETSEQGGERLRAEERKRAAVKRVNESSEQRKSASQLNANEQLSEGPTKPASRGKSASQVTANGKLSNGPTKPVSSGKSASQLTASGQLSKCPTKVPRTEKSAWEPCENGQLANDLRKPARNRTSGWELDENEQRWSAGAKARRKEWKPEATSSIAKGFRHPTTKSAGGHFCSPAKRIFAQSRMGWPWKPWFVSRRMGSGRDCSLPSLRGKPAPLSLCRLQIKVEAWPLSAARDDLFTCSRCIARKEAVSILFCWERHGSWKRPAELQGLSEVEELLIARAFPIMSIYRKLTGSTRIQGTRLLNLPEDIQGFLNSLPANVSNLPILVVRKQGAGEFLK